MELKGKDTKIRYTDFLESDKSADDLNFILDHTKSEIISLIKKSVHG